jgi:hypothetical protein
MKNLTLPGYHESTRLDNQLNFPVIVRATQWSHGPTP